MKHDLNEYIKETEKALSEGRTDGAFLESMRIHIGFFQHERLVHLIVTMTFALLVMISLALTVYELYFGLLFLLFLALEVPYIVHYYKLENGVQKLQRLYGEAEERAKK